MDVKSRQDETGGAEETREITTQETGPGESDRSMEPAARAPSYPPGFSTAFSRCFFIAFYMFIDGEAFFNELKRPSPLDDRYDEDDKGDFQRWNFVYKGQG